jgi:YD repeat-containing protein
LDIPSYWLQHMNVQGYRSANMIAYDQLNRVTSFTDTLGNQVQYEYDSMGRVTKITPAQGANYRTQYTYNKNGSLASVAIYVAGTAETTSYTYDTNSGKLTQRNLPTVSAANLRTTYAYDSAGRLEFETITKETGGGATNLYRTQYAYAFIAAGSGGGRSLTRTEQTYSGGWVNDNKVLYEWNALEWMKREQRHDWVSSAWSAVYDINQEYDKRGNRTRYDKNVQGSSADYGLACDLAYTFDGSSLLSAIGDANNTDYSCAVTCDANNNITALDEAQIQRVPPPPKTNHLYTYFDVDALNRVTAHRTKHYVAGGTNAWMWAKRAHEYDGLGRLVRSTYKTWQDGSSEPAGTSLEHTYDKNGKHLQNYDGTATYGEVWHWAGNDPMPETAHPLKSPNADTASTSAYNHGDNTTPQRRTFVNPTPTEGDERNLWGQGRPMAKDSSGSGANWDNGTVSQPSGVGFPPVESRLMFEGTVTTALGRATDAREKGRIGIFGTGLSYAGSSGRVTSETLGRDINPLGRGDGMAYVAGWMNLGGISALLPHGFGGNGMGNGINNGCCGRASQSYRSLSNPSYWGPHQNQPSAPPINLGRVPRGRDPIIIPNERLPRQEGVKPDPGFNSDYNPTMPWDPGWNPERPPIGPVQPSPGVIWGSDRYFKVTPAGDPPRPLHACCQDNIRLNQTCDVDIFGDNTYCTVAAYFTMPNARAMCEQYMNGDAAACTVAVNSCIAFSLAGLLSELPGIAGFLIGLIIAAIGGVFGDGSVEFDPANILSLLKSILLAVLATLLPALVLAALIADILATIACCLMAGDVCMQVVSQGSCYEANGNKVDWQHACRDEKRGGGGGGDGGDQAGSPTGEYW